MVNRERAAASTRCKAKVAAHQEAEKNAKEAAEDATREVARRKGYGTDIDAIEEVRGAWAKWKGRYDTAKDIGKFASGKASWREQYDIVARNAQKAGSPRIVCRRI